MRSGRRFDLIGPMEMLAPEREPSPAFGSGTLQRLTYAALGLLLIGGAWIRFNDRLAEVSPGLASPVAQQLILSRQPTALAELALLAPGAEPAAIAGMSLPRDQSAAMAADLRRDRLRLVQVPLFDAGAGGGSRVVSVSSGGYSRLVSLTRVATLVTLPIDRVGTISFQVAEAGSPDPVGIGMLTISGPLRLPDLAAGQQLDVGVVAQ